MRHILVPVPDNTCEGCEHNGINSCNLFFEKTDTQDGINRPCQSCLSATLKVPDLVWKEDDFGELYVSTPFGRITIRSDRSGFIVFGPAFAFDLPCRDITKPPSIKEAKSFAQKHYSELIFKALGIEGKP